MPHPRLPWGGGGGEAPRSGGVTAARAPRRGRRCPTVPRTSGGCQGFSSQPPPPGGGVQSPPVQKAVGWGKRLLATPPPLRCRALRTSCNVIEVDRGSLPGLGKRLLAGSQRPADLDPPPPSGVGHPRPEERPWWLPPLGPGEGEDPVPPAPGEVVVPLLPLQHAVHLPGTAHTLSVLEPRSAPDPPPPPTPRPCHTMPAGHPPGGRKDRYSKPMPHVGAWPRPVLPCGFLVGARCGRVVPSRVRALPCQRYCDMYSAIILNGSRRFVVPLLHPNPTGEAAAFPPAAAAAAAVSLSEVGVIFHVTELSKAEQARRPPPPRPLRPVLSDFALAGLVLRRSPQPDSNGPQGFICCGPVSSDAPALRPPPAAFLSLAQAGEGVVRFVCQHTVGGRVRIRRVLNPRHVLDRKVYLRAVVEDLTDTDPVPPHPSSWPPGGGGPRTRVSGKPKTGVEGGGVPLAPPTKSMFHVCRSVQRWCRKGFFAVRSIG